MAKDPIPLLPYLSQISLPTPHLTFTAVNRHHPPATSMPHRHHSPPPLQEALRRLCRDHGWSYAALYRPDLGDHRLLRMEECYYEEHSRTIVDKMRNRVHVVGEGSLGAAAASGKHQWIYSDTCCRDLSPTNAGDNLDMFPGGADMLHQFIAGIKSITIVSIPSFGVIQFGSSQKISESSKFLDQVHYVFWQLETMTGLYQNLDAQQSMNSPDTHAPFASVILSGYAYSSNKNVSNSLENVCQIGLANAQSSTDPTRPPSLFSRGSYDGSIYHGSNMALHVSPMSAASSSITESIGFSNFTSRNFSLHLKNQCPANGTEAVGLLSAKAHVHPNSFFPNSLASCTSANMSAKEVTNLPMEDRLLSGMTLHGYHTTLPTESHSSIPHLNTFHYLDGGSSESCSLYESPGDLSTEKLLYKESPFALELPGDLFSFPEDSTLKHSQLVHSLDDPVNDINHSGDQPLKQLSDVLTVPTVPSDDLLSISFVSSGLAGGDSVGCSRTITLPGTQVENSSACAVNSQNTGYDFNPKSSNVSDLLLSDHDLFDGMELDLSPRVLRQDNWDDIVMPLGSGSCSNLSISIPEYIDIGLTEDADKGFFLESTFELLDAVVTGNVNLSSNDSSAPTTVNSVVDLDSELHLSKSTTAGSQVYRNENTPLCHPSLIRTSEILLPECSLQKIMEGSPKETFSKSHVSSWAEDSCSMNSERYVINEPKKPEENAKFPRKRARPGESTRPRPKDRQQIQDRVKELREMVPNGAKCSIDSLLDRTIKHMLFLKSVTKYVDKLRQADEPKMIYNETGILLKDKLSNSGGGATWAYEVAGQTMVCPILVEDLNPPGQMLVEMCCEDRGFFLEIADIICGFGLTIMKGVMEIRDGKIWARFMVEANRDVTRMDLFLSLVQLLQQTSCSRSSEQPTNVIDKGVPEFTSYQQSPAPIPVSLADGLR